MGSNNVTTVAAGEVIAFPAGFPAALVDHTVKPRCAGPGDGQWGCVTHQLVFMNNLQADIHEHDDKPHVAVWLCFEHGPEVP